MYEYLYFYIYIPGDLNDSKLFKDYIILNSATIFLAIPIDFIALGVSVDSYQGVVRKMSIQRKL